MRILTYKRTHMGDPDPSGYFGVNMCMGKVRDYEFDAVIGIGGIGAEPGREGIAGKINWIGIGPTKHPAPTKRASEVSFDHFHYLEQEGPMLETFAPNLARRLFHKGARLLLKDYSESERQEALRILEWSKSEQPKKSTGVEKFRMYPPSGCKLSKKQRKCSC